MYDRNRTVAANGRRSGANQGNPLRHRWLHLCGRSRFWLLQALSLILLASPSLAQKAYYNTVSSGNTTTQGLEVRRSVRIQCPQLSAPYGRVRWDGGSWSSLSSFDGGSPVTYQNLYKRKASAPAGPGNSGSQHEIQGSTHLMEFDWNENGTADASVYVEFPTSYITLMYPGPTGVSWAVSNAPAVIVDISAGAEKTATVNDPLPDQGDSDGDGVPDIYDEDDDNDGIPDELDLFPNDPAETGDLDGDGVGNNADTDRDGDGVPNDEDKFPNNPAEWADHDGDGVGDNIDPDDDNDGKSDSTETAEGSNPKGPVGSGDAGTGSQDNQGDGNGNPGSGDGAGKPITGGTSNESLGNMGAPGELPKRSFEYFKQQVGEENIGPEEFGPIDEMAVEGFVESIQEIASRVKNDLSGWRPFQEYTPSGDMTSFTADLGTHGSVIIPFPTDPANIGIFRGCCLFALYWGYVIAVMRILKI